MITLRDNHKYHNRQDDLKRFMSNRIVDFFPVTYVLHYNLY